jgi:hypothetical protein
MRFEPMREKCPICNAQISSDIKVNPGNNPRFERVSDWICDNGHKIEDQTILNSLKESVENFNLTA